MSEEKQFDTLQAKAKALVNGGKVLCVTIQEEADVKYGFFKMPDRHVLGLAMAKQKVNPVEAIEFILMNCLLTSVSTIDLSNDAHFWACLDHSDALMARLEEKKSSSVLV